MLAKRIIVVIIAMPIGMAIIALGGVWYALTLAAIIGVAAWEYNRLFRMAGYEPSNFLVIGGSVALILGRYFFGFQYADIILSGLVMAAMAYHLIVYEKGRDQAAIDFGITVAGILYLGWLSAYLVSLRELPDGKWWVLLVFPAIWSVDAGAYLIGSRFGKHKMCPRISPNKTWEGFIGGLIVGVLGSMLMAAIWSLASPAITPIHGAWIGLFLAVLTPLGDLGESMIKRLAGAKDSSHLIPGHGGMFDRIDSWLWAGVIGFVLINQFFLR